jgi:hypothetical protein
MRRVVTAAAKLIGEVERLGGSAPGIDWCSAGKQSFEFVPDARNSGSRTTVLGSGLENATPDQGVNQVLNGYLVGDPHQNDGRSHEPVVEARTGVRQQGQNIIGQAGAPPADALNELWEERVVLGQGEKARARSRQAQGDRKLIHQRTERPREAGSNEPDHELDDTAHPRCVQRGGVDEDLPEGVHRLSTEWMRGFPLREQWEEVPTEIAVHRELVAVRPPRVPLPEGSDAKLANLQIRETVQERSDPLAALFGIHPSSLH